MSRPGVTVPPRAVVRPLAWAGTLWRFSRPHTLVGTTTSILGIYVIAAATLPPLRLGGGLGDLALTLLAGAAVNVCIVGVNQVTDVAVDRVNKPHLPLAAGELSPEAARAIVTGCAALALALAVTQGWVEVAAVSVALAVGAAYSLPPLRLRRRPAVAAASISLVRALVVNLGVWWHFADSLGGRGEVSPLPGPIVALTLFVLPFSFAIAVLKDVPDTPGDRRFHVATFALRLGPRAAFRLGLAALALAYAGMIVAAPLALAGEADPWILVAGHLAAAAALATWAWRTSPEDRIGFTRFYLRVWGLLLAEYLIVPAAVLAA